MSQHRSAAVDEPGAHQRLDVARSDWFAAAPESEGFAYYLAVLRSKLWFVAVIVGVCVGAAVFGLSLTSNVYQSRADLLITPVDSNNATLAGLGLPSASSDPTRDIETMAQLIKTQSVANRVIRRLHLNVTSDGLLARIDVTPVASSNIVSVSARASEPNQAAQIANAFAGASVADRTARLRGQLDTIIPQLRRQIAQLKPSDQSTRPALVQRLQELEALKSIDDPTIRLAVPAVPNASAISPRPMLTVVAAIFAGLVLSGAIVFGSQFLDPRLRREEQLRRYRIPILARVPKDRHTFRRGQTTPLLPNGVSLAMHDSYSLLAATLGGEGNGGAIRSVLVTGPNSGDGKTTSALNLAVSLASQSRVILVEEDARRPTLGRSLGLKPKHGVSSVLTGRSTLEEALVSGGSLAPAVRLLIQAPGEPPSTANTTAANARRLIGAAHLLADWLVVDAPPLTVAPDAIPFAKHVDAVVLVVRIGNTRLKELAQLAELLVQQDIEPVGFVLVGGRGATAYYV